MKKFILHLLLSFPCTVFSQTVSEFIVVDQFGYRPQAEKIAVIRNPIAGYDSAKSFSPGSNYALIDATDETSVYTGPPVAWKAGSVDDSSGDMAWWFDFSTYEAPGTYYILDVDNNVRSYEFAIDEHVYAEVLKHAVRTFFYQRAGYAKEAAYAGEKWADGASHLGSLQDSECRRYDAPDDASTERDLRGGWYDAGDYNKYTPWTSNYIVDLLKAYELNPDSWGDNYCLPYSDNGMPDIIDEIKWGLEHLLRLQEADGSLISVVSLASGAPPSSATGQSLYGGVNTTSALAAASAYAYGAKVFEELGYQDFSNTLKESAIAAWGWAVANPDVIWENNSAEYNSVGIGAGQQETDDYGRFAYKIRAAVHLYALTQDAEYKSFVEANYEDVHLTLWSYAYPFEQENQEALLYYASLPDVTAGVASSIRSTYESAMEDTNNFAAFDGEIDPYMAHLADYVWGSNGVKSRKGLMFTNYIDYELNAANNEDAIRAAERYVHYIHGVNPLNFSYLSNMYAYGAENGVNEFYHTWFGDGTDWDRVGVDPYGPAPGYLTGGANPAYDWDGCCPSGCSGNTCSSSQRQRIKDQPSQKAYDDFNTSWPMNSWSVTENSCGYQVAYIRLLSSFVNDPTATLACEAIEEEEPPVTGMKQQKAEKALGLYPNPTSRFLTIKSEKPGRIRIFNGQGILLTEMDLPNSKRLDMHPFAEGLYFIQLSDGSEVVYEAKVIKQHHPIP